MANQILVRAGGNLSAAASWESVRDAGDATGPPGIGDDVSIDVDSGDLAHDDNSAALGSLDMSGYTGTVTCPGATKTFDVDGNAVIGGEIVKSYFTATGNITIDAGCTFPAPANCSITQNTAAAVAVTLTCNAVRLPLFIVNNAGVTSFTLQDAMLCEAFTLTNGKFNDNGQTVGLYGNITYTAGALTSTGVWTIAANSTINAPGAASFTIKELSINSGITATIVTYLYVQKLSGSGTIQDSGGAEYLRFQLPADNFWAFTGTCDIDVWLASAIDISTGAAITLSNKDLVIRNAVAAKTVTADGNINLGTGTLAIWSFAAGIGTLAMGAYGLTCGAGATAVTLGTTDATKRGKLDCGTGTHYIRGAIVHGHVDQTGANINQLDLSSCVMYLDGALNCLATATILVSNTAAKIYGKDTTSAHLDYVDLSASNPLTVYWCGDDGHNTSVTFVSPHQKQVYVTANAAV